MNKKIINGHWDGQEIWREQTSGEKLADLLYIQQKGKPDCPICEGSGTMYVPNGEDDVEGETCDCISGLKEKLANILK